jgi:deoxyribonuclease-4
MSAAYRSCVFFGAHVSSLGGIHTTLDRAKAMGADAVQLFTQSPRMWRPTNHDPANLEAFKERRTELGIAPAAFSRTRIYLVNLAAPETRSTRSPRAVMRNTMEVARAIEADGVVFHVGSHLGAGLEVGLARCVPALQETLGAHLGHDLAAAGGLAGGAGRSADRSTSSPRSSKPAARTSASACARHVPPLRLRRRHHGSRSRRRPAPRGGRAHRPRSAARAARERRRRPARLQPRPARDIGKGSSATSSGVFLSHPKLQGLPAFLEVPGTDRHGPDAKEIRKARTSTSGGCRLPLADPRRGDARATSLSAVQIGISAITPDLQDHYGLSIGQIGDRARRDERGHDADAARLGNRSATGSASGSRS